MHTIWLPGYAVFIMRNEAVMNNIVHECKERRDYLCKRILSEKNNTKQKKNHKCI